MKKLKKFLSLFLSLLMIMSMFAGLDVSSFAETQGVLTYQIINGEAMITDCAESASGELIIPDTLGGCPVTGIGDSAFCICVSLTSITIPDSVTSIGDEAFYYCTSLTSITIPDSVTSIGDAAFWYCTSLTSITIPDSVTSISERAFSYCASLTSITIPDSVTSIGNYAFRDCSSLTSITIPDSVTWIGAYAFESCTSLTNFTVDDKNPYYSSDSYGVLFNKDKTALITYPMGNSNTSYEIPDGVTWIDSSAFSHCSSLTSITIPDSVTSIRSWAFEYCSSLTSITIPDSVTSIGDWAFYGCSSLTSITIPDSVTSIGEGAFEYCSSLTSITIPDSMTSIGDSAFRDCISLTSITIPDSVTSIGERAFYDCRSLTSITIPDSVIGIGNGAFDHCTSLTSITIPDSVTRIGELAFGDCTSLTSITIPDSVTSIGDYAIGYFRNDSTWEYETIEGFIIYGNPGTAAETYAKTNGISYQYLPEEEEHVHSYSEWVVTKEATYWQTGKREAVCEGCGDVKTEEIAKLTADNVVTDAGSGVSVLYADGVFDGEIQVEAVQEFDGESFHILNQEKGNFNSVLYDIIITKNGEKVQPDGVVLVAIPLPEGYHPETTVVYYITNNGSLEKMDAVVEGDTIYFEASHFSSYALVDESTEKTPDCDCICHSTSKFVQFFYKLARFFWKLFGMESKRICECGVAHW